MNPIEPQLLLLSISHQLCPCHALSAATLCVFEHHTACGKEPNELQTVNAWGACARGVQVKKTLFHFGVSAMRYSAYLQLDVKDPDFSISEHSLSRFCWHAKAANTGQNSKENKVAHLPILFPYSARLDLLWPHWGRNGRTLPSCQIGCQCQFAFYAIHICSKCLEAGSFLQSHPDVSCLHAWDNARLWLFQNNDDEKKKKARTQGLLSGLSYYHPLRLLIPWLFLFDVAARQLMSTFASA